MPDAGIAGSVETREQFERALLSFIAGLRRARRTRSTPVARVDSATPLFESGLIDSLAILDLIAFVEAATGQRIPVRLIDMRHFGSVARIADAFCPAASDGREPAGSQP
jgi:acyl carrier protein